MKSIPRALTALLVFILVSTMATPLSALDLLKEPTPTGTNPYYNSRSETAEFKADAERAAKAIEEATADATAWGKLLETYCYKLGALHGLKEEYDRLDEFLEAAPELITVYMDPEADPEIARRYWYPQGYPGEGGSQQYWINGKAVRGYDNLFWMKDATGKKVGMPLIPKAKTTNGANGLPPTETYPAVVQWISFLKADVDRLALKPGDRKQDLGLFGWFSAGYTEAEIDAIHADFFKKYNDPAIQTDAAYIWAHYANLYDGGGSKVERKNFFLSALQRNMRRLIGELLVIREFAYKNNLALGGAKCPYPEDVIILEAKDVMAQNPPKQYANKDKVPVTAASRQMP